MRRTKSGRVTRTRVHAPPHVLQSMLDGSGNVSLKRLVDPDHFIYDSRFIGVGIDDQIVHWGSGSEAYDTVLQRYPMDPNTLRSVVFDTEGGHPKGALEALSRREPSSHIYVGYADPTLQSSECASYILGNGAESERIGARARTRAGGATPSYIAYEFAAYIAHGKPYIDVSSEQASEASTSGGEQQNAEYLLRMCWERVSFIEEQRGSQRWVEMEHRLGILGVYTP